MKVKKAFTLIEIIFTITIMGILALVAIPKLAATYDDAKITVALNDIGSLINDLSTYYTTKDSYSSNILDMTYIPNVEYSTPWNSVLQQGVLTYSTLDNNLNLESCVNISLQNQDGNLTVSNVINPSGEICKTLQEVNTYKRLLGTKLVGGNRVKF